MRSSLGTHCVPQMTLNNPSLTADLMQSPTNRGCAGSKLIYSETLKFSLILFSALSFLAYGAGCLFSAHMKREFERYRLGSQRVLVGALQWVAALGLLAGLSQPWMGRSAAAGLALMMLVAVGVRIRIKDSLVQTLPALFYLLLNAYLCLAAF